MSNKYQDAKGEESKTIIDTSYTQWSHGGGGVYYPVGITVTSLPPGVYLPVDNQGQTLYVKQDIKIDDLMTFPDSVSDEIVNEIDVFWAKGEKFKEFGFLHRRGIMLVGKTGSGKTSTVHQILHKLLEKGGIAFLCGRPHVLATALRNFRQVEPDRHVVCIFEDIDATIRSAGEEEILKLLDGESQIDKILNLATTNYPESLDKRLTGRPRRFDRVIEIGYPNEKVRGVYFKNKLHISDDELDKWVSATADFSFAAMSELVISVKCFGHDFTKSVEVLKSLMSKAPSSDNFSKNTVGFSQR